MTQLVSSSFEATSSIILASSVKQNETRNEAGLGHSLETVSDKRVTMKCRFQMSIEHVIKH